MAYLMETGYMGQRRTKLAQNRIQWRAVKQRWTVGICYHNARWASQLRLTRDEKQHLHVMYSELQLSFHSYFLNQSKNWILFQPCCTTTITVHLLQGSQCQPGLGDWTLH